MEDPVQALLAEAKNHIVMGKTDQRGKASDAAVGHAMHALDAMHKAILLMAERIAMAAEGGTR